MIKKLTDRLPRSKRRVNSQNDVDRRRTALAQNPPLPALPKPDARGYYPAIETAYALMARKYIRRRLAAKLTQAELASRAGIRLSTLQKLEAAEHVPGERTLLKLEAVLERCNA
jgi:ribosome-binding protein aMBF1 (putative translation factor)